MIDFVTTVKAQNATTISASVAFSPLALNPSLVVFLAACHQTNGLAGDTNNGTMTYGASTLFLRRSAATPNPAGGGPRPWPSARNHVWSSSMNEPVPMSGTVSTGFTSPTHVILTAIGMTGTNFSGVEDAVADQALTNFGLTLFPFPVDFPPGLASWTARQNPDSPVWTPGPHLVDTLVTESFAGLGVGYPTTGVWTASAELGWPMGVNNIGGLGWELCGTAFSFLGGLAELAPPPPSNLEPLSRYAREEIAVRTGILIGKDIP